MSSLRRRPLLMLLMWLALAWLPLRGLAQVAMHLPTGADAVVAAPCHGQHDDPAQQPPADSPCNLCDLCHGGALPMAQAVEPDIVTPPRVALAPALTGLLAPRRFERPPRA